MSFITKDSGQRQAFATGSVRDTAEGKGRFDLIPTAPLRRLAGLYERGAAKYGDRNWQRGQPLMRYVDSALRHINCLVAGEPLEDHAAAVAWNMFGFMYTAEMIAAERLPKELDNRPEPEPQYSSGLSFEGVNTVLTEAAVAPPADPFAEDCEGAREDIDADESDTAPADASDREWWFDHDTREATIDELARDIAAVLDRHGNTKRTALTQVNPLVIAWKDRVGLGDTITSIGTRLGEIGARPSVEEIADIIADEIREVF